LDKREFSPFRKSERFDFFPLHICHRFFFPQSRCWALFNKRSRFFFPHLMELVSSCSMACGLFFRFAVASPIIPCLLDFFVDLLAPLSSPSVTRQKEERLLHPFRERQHPFLFPSDGRPPFFFFFYLEVPAPTLFFFFLMTLSVGIPPSRDSDPSPSETLFSMVFERTSPLPEHRVFETGSILRARQPFFFSPTPAASLPPHASSFSTLGYFFLAFERPFFPGRGTFLLVRSP